jgi:propionyl-CoA carboxylase beta chain
MPTIDTARDGTVRRFANPFVAAERGYIDEVIMPHSTRKLHMLRHKHMVNPPQKHDNLPL